MLGEVRREVLENGLAVLVASLPHLHRAHVACMFNVGSRYEAEELNGISHFLEHMMFRGTRRYPSLTAISAAFEDLGGTLDGGTTREHTMYDTYLPPDQLLPGVALLGEVMCEPRMVGVVKERAVIHQEMLDDVNDSGKLIDLDTVSHRMAYGEHPLGYSIIGTEASLKRINAGALRAHYERFYCGTNGVLTIAGRVGSVEATLEAAAAAFGGLSRGSRVVGDAAPEPEVPGPLRLEVTRSRGASLTDVVFVVRGLSETDPRFAALETLVRIMDDGLSTRLPRRLTDELGLAYDVSGYINVYQDTSLWIIQASVSHTKLVRVVEALCDLLEALRVEDVEEGEVVRARSRARWEMEALLDSPRSVSGWVSTSELYARPFDAEARVAALMEVEAAGLKEAARAVLQPGRVSVALVGQVGRKTEEQIQARLERFNQALGQG